MKKRGSKPSLGTWTCNGNFTVSDASNLHADMSKGRKMTQNEAKKVVAESLKLIKAEKAVVECARAWGATLHEYFFNRALKVPELMNITKVDKDLMEVVKSLERIEKGR